MLHKVIGIPMIIKQESGVDLEILPFKCMFKQSGGGMLSINKVKLGIYSLFSVSNANTMW